jgi:O-antigen/teichoic acid export membrane protein
MTATNLLGTLVTSLDQFLVGSILGVREVAWYNVPFSLVSRLSALPAALIRVLFPEFSKGRGIQSSDMANRSVRFIGVAFAPLIVGALLTLHPFLTLWMGQEFALHAAPVGLIFPLGIWLNAIASVPLSLVQARGRPDLIVKILLVEAGPFIGLLWLSVHAFGLEGAAWMWTLRNLIYAVIFMWLGRIDRLCIRELWPAVIFILGAWALATMVPFQSAGYALVGAALMIITVVWSIWREPRLREMAINFTGRSWKLFQ